MALDTTGQELYPGDRVIYTANHYLHFGIVYKINVSSVTITKFDNKFEKKLSYNTGNPIASNKIYKLQ